MLESDILSVNWSGRLLTKLWHYEMFVKDDITGYSLVNVVQTIAMARESLGDLENILMEI